MPSGTNTGQARQAEPAAFTCLLVENRAPNERLKTSIISSVGRETLHLQPEMDTNYDNEYE